MINDTYIKVVNGLVDLRQNHNITITEMANFAGVSRQSIYNFEQHIKVSYKLLLTYITHPAFSPEELDPIYKLLGR